MLRDITLGQYYPADSVVHKLDPRVKLFATMIYIIALFTFRGNLWEHSFMSFPFFCSTTGAICLEPYSLR